MSFAPGFDGGRPAASEVLCAKSVTPERACAIVRAKEARERRNSGFFHSKLVEPVALTQLGEYGELGLVPTK